MGWVRASLAQQSHWLLLANSPHCDHSPQLRMRTSYGRPQSHDHHICSHIFCFPRSFYEDASRMLISANCFNKNNAQTVAKVMWKGFCFFVCFCTKYFLLFECNTFVFTRMHNVVCVYIYIVNLIKSCVPFAIFFFFEGSRARACAWVNKICSPLSFIFIKIRLSGVLWTLRSGFHNYCLFKSQLFAG